MTDHPDVRRGQSAYDSEGTSLGRVLQCDESGFVIENGVVFAEHYRVEYDEVASADAGQVRLRFPASALVPEEEADAWDPARDPVGTAGGTDLEPLRAGMDEIDEQQHCVRAASAGSGAQRRARRGARAWRDALARRAGPAEATGAALRPQPSARTPVRAPVESDDALEHRIEEEVEDFEREAGCGRRSDVLLERAAEERARASASRALVTRDDARAGRSPRRERRRQLRSAGPPAVSSPASTAPPAARLDYAKAAPDAVQAMRALEQHVRDCGLERPLLDLLRLRVSQLNGCTCCVEMHAQDARRGGETEQRLDALQSWNETTCFTPRERAALAWTEAVTRLGADHIDDGTYQLARERFGEEELVNLTLAIIAINGWNRLAIAFRAEPGTYRPA